MTVKIQSPQPTIFQSDPIEQIAMRGVLDRDMSGLSYMFKNAAQDRQVDKEAAYMNGVREANRMAMMLQQQEDMQKLLIESLKQGPEYAKAGLPVADVPLLSRLFTSGGTGQAADASMLVNLLKESQIAENNAKAAAAGEASKDQVTFEGSTSPAGPTINTYRVKSKDPIRAQMELQRQIEADKRARQPGQPYGWGTPSAEWDRKTIEYRGRGGQQ